MAGVCVVAVLVCWWVLAGSLLFEARLFSGEGRCGGCQGLGCFGWAGSDAWLVFSEPVGEGGSTTPANAAPEHWSLTRRHRPRLQETLQTPVRARINQQRLHILLPTGRARTVTDRRIELNVFAHRINLVTTTL